MKFIRPAILLTAIFCSLSGCQKSPAKPEPSVKQMKFGYTIIYVADVAATVEFYERAFDLKRRFVHESGQYAEMETGATVLAFTGDELASQSVTPDYIPNKPESHPGGFEIAFTAEDVPASFAKAVNAGAAVVKEPATKPWGQTVGYVRDLNGIIVEIGTSVSQ